MLYHDLKLGYQAASLIDGGRTDRQISRSIRAPRMKISQLRHQAGRLQQPGHGARLSILMEYMLLRMMQGPEDTAAPSAEEAARDLGENDPAVMERLFELLSESGLAARVPAQDEIPRSGATPPGRDDGRFIEPHNWEGPPSALVGMLLNHEPKDETREYLKAAVLGSLLAVSSVRILLDITSPAMTVPMPEHQHTPRWPHEEITYIEFQPAVRLPPPPGGATCPGLLVTKADEDNDPRMLFLVTAVDDRLYDIVPVKVDLRTGAIVDEDGGRDASPKALAITTPLRHVARTLSNPAVTFRPGPLNHNQARRLRQKDLPNPWIVPEIRQRG